MLKVGISGIGFMGMIHYLAYQRIEGIKVAALCETYNKERLTGDWTKIKGNFGPAGTMMDLTGISTYDNYEAMLADPELDVIDVCLHPSRHAEATIAALDAGKHVFCEKPIALRPEEGAAMIEAAKRNNKILCIGHVLPFHLSHNFIVQAANSGRYGKLLGGNFLRITPDPVWLPNFYDMSVFGGPMLDLHIHDVHFIRALFGMPKVVQGVGRCRGNIPEFFNIQYLYDDPDLVVTATSGNIRQQGRQFTHGYEVQFEKATVFCESFNNVPVTVLNDDGTVEKPDLGSCDDVVPFANELTEALKAFTSGTPSPLLDGKLAGDALTLCYKEMESIRTRKPVDC